MGAPCSTLAVADTDLAHLHNYHAYLYYCGEISIIFRPCITKTSYILLERSKRKLGNHKTKHFDLNLSSLESLT